MQQLSWLLHKFASIDLIIIMHCIMNLIIIMLNIINRIIISISLIIIMLIIMLNIFNLITIIINCINIMVMLITLLIFQRFIVHVYIQQELIVHIRQPFFYQDKYLMTPGTSEEILTIFYANAFRPITPYYVFLSVSALMTCTFGLDGVPCHPLVVCHSACTLAR